MDQAVNLVMLIVSHWKEIVTQAFMVTAAIGGVLKALESFLQFIAPFTPWKWDDNLSTKLGKWAALKIFNKPSN